MSGPDLFVLEQNGLLRIIQNGSLLPGSALDLQSRVQVSPVGTGPLNAANANDERGLLGLAFHPGFNNPASPGFRTLYTYTSEALSSPTFPAPNGATQNYIVAINFPTGSDNGYQGLGTALNFTWFAQQ